MRSFIAVVFVGAALLGACAAPVATSSTGLQMSGAQELSTKRAISAVLAEQTDGWNSGDIDQFMAGYWRSSELRFASGGNVTRGWVETNARYKARYATPELMGQLSFADEEIVVLSDDAAVLHGRWTLVRENDAPGGLFTLIFRKFDGEWKIVSDTTTSAD